VVEQGVGAALTEGWTAEHADGGHAGVGHDVPTQCGRVLGVNIVVFSQEMQPEDCEVTGRGGEPGVMGHHNLLDASCTALRQKRLDRKVPAGRAVSDAVAG